MKKIFVVMLIGVFGIVSISAADCHDYKALKQFHKGNNPSQLHNPHALTKAPKPIIPPFIWEKLDLSQQQEDEIIDIKNQSQKQIITLKADIKKLQLDKQNFLRQEKFNSARTVVENIAEKNGKIQKILIDIRENILSILTPEQKEILKKEMKKQKHNPKDDFHKRSND